MYNFMKKGAMMLLIAGLAMSVTKTAGLRPELARVLGVQSECTISDNCADVVFCIRTMGISVGI